MIVFGAACLIYVWMFKGLSWKQIEMMVIAMSNSFGLILMFVFLAPGLIDIPRNIWRQRKLKDEQERLEIEVGQLSAMQDELYYEIENHIKILYNIGKHTDDDEYKRYVDMILVTVPRELIDTFPTGLDSYFPKELYEEDLQVIRCYLTYRNYLQIYLLRKT